MEWIIVLSLFAVGASVGSFVNVLISRSVASEEWVRSRSKCDHCKKPLAWYDTIPLLSYLVLAGKSRCCRKRLSWQHPIVEGLTGILFVWWYMVGAIFFQLVSEPFVYIQPLYWLLLAILLLVILVTDLYYGLIPMIAVYGAIFVTLIYRLILIFGDIYQPRDLGLSLLAALAASFAFFALRVVTKGRGMGDGDIYLALLIGLLLSWPDIWLALLVSFVTGAIVGLVLVALKLKTVKQTLPFGPFMIASIFITLLYSEQLYRILGFG